MFQSTKTAIIVLLLMASSFLLGCGGPDIGSGSPSDVEQVHNDIKELGNALYQSDVDTVLAYTHSKIISAMGGMSKARTTLESTLAEIESLNIRLEEHSFPEAPTFVKTRSNRFVIVPTKSIVTVGGQRAESLNYQFGVQSTESDQWKYIEGSRINRDNVRKLFPDFPADFEFPEFYRKKI